MLTNFTLAMYKSEKYQKNTNTNTNTNSQKNTNN